MFICGAVLADLLSIFKLTPAYSYAKIFASVKNTVFLQTTVGWRNELLKMLIGWVKYILQYFLQII